jgi:hypothetical protein
MLASTALGTRALAVPSAVPRAVPSCSTRAFSGPGGRAAKSLGVKLENLIFRSGMAVVLKGLESAPE